MDDEKLKIASTTGGLTPGFEQAAAPGPINPVTGQHTSYWILNEDERKKGFVRPVRRTYVHVGRRICGKPASDSVVAQMVVKCKDGEIYVCASEPAHEGECFALLVKMTAKHAERFLTKGLLGGCDTVTTMSLDIAQTYARDPNFYSAGMCVRCKEHFPHEELRWEDGSVVGS